MFFLTVLQLKHIFLSLKRSLDRNKQQLKTNNLHEANDPPLLVTSPRYTGNQLRNTAVEVRTNVPRSTDSRNLSALSTNKATNNLAFFTGV